MKRLKHIELKNGDKIIVDSGTGKELNTANLITICLGQSKYSSMTEQWQAYEITKKIEDGKDVELEDADYALVKKMVEAFEPYRNGFTFMPFLDLFRE
jgi:hypothetical protein